MPIEVGSGGDQLLDLGEGEGFAFAADGLGQRDSAGRVAIDVSQPLGASEGGAEGFDVHDRRLGGAPRVHPLVEEPFDHDRRHIADRLDGGFIDGFWA